jgi:hypothetical protein
MVRGIATDVPATQALRAVAIALTFVTAGCNHLSLFEDKPQATAHAPVTQPHRASKKQQTAALRGSAASPDATPNAAAPTQNPVRAAELRAAALEQMNRGAIDEAVVNLTEASALDPSNVLIQRDLDRAKRIQSTVQRAPS